MTSVDESGADGAGDRLQRQLDVVSDLRAKCLARSALRAAAAARRLAEADRQLMPFLLANFEIMNLSQSTFDPAAGREAAVRAIALLESADEARKFQGDYDERAYDHTVGWMSACAYDNLATATGRLQGYNSPGMQACVADGIAVCRRTGKLRCVTCFREYATEVSRAADDLPMALHHARTNVNRPPQPGDDRRFVGAKDEATLLLLSGDLHPAWAAGQRAATFAETYHNPLGARRSLRPLLSTIATLAGRADWADAAGRVDIGDVPRDEEPVEDWRGDLAAAVADPAGAVDVLTRWDKRLADDDCLDEWFETRLRLVAAYRLAGQPDRAAALAKPLEAKATTAQDFLTLKRLKRLLDPAVPASAVPTVAAEALPVRVESAMAEPSASPLDPVFEQLAADVQGEMAAAAESDGERTPDLATIARRLVMLPPNRVGRADDAARFLRLLAFLSQAPGTDDGRAWAWARAVAAPHPRDAMVLNLLAAYGAQLRQREDAPPSTADLIPAAELEDLFRRAMDVDPNQPMTFGRAGLFYLNQGNDGEAERCLARAFRLDRTSAFVAQRLAEIYSRTDRGPDALAVLDLCLREQPADERDADLLWKAALAASGMDKQAIALTYLDAFEETKPRQRWVQYYRAIALLGLERYAEAANAIEAEAGRIDMPTALHVHTVRAAAAAGLNDSPGVRRHVTAAIGSPLSLVNYLSRTGVVACYTRLYRAAAKLPADDAVRKSLDRRLLVSGLTPDEFWDRQRQGGTKVQDVKHFWCDLRQPLDRRWADAGTAMPGSDGWPAYRIRYGVLAADEADASRRAVAWQIKSSPAAALVPDVERVTADPATYTDVPGVTQRSYPEPAGE